MTTGDSKSSEVDQLRARAILASQDDKPTPEQAQHAYDLWSALTQITPKDSSAHFNTAYWAQELYGVGHDPSKAFWLYKTYFHYKEALGIKPDMHEAANNWGSALDDEAKALADSGDLPAAQVKWAEAATKYQQALAIKPDKHEAANNLGLALAGEAQALAGSGDLPAAQAKWAEAAAKYQQALAIKPDMHEAANNWGAALAREAQALQKEGQKEQAQTLLAKAQGVLEKQGKAFPQSAGALAYNLACVYGMQGLATLCVAQLEVSREAGELPDRQHLEQDGDLDAVRNAPEFQAWWLAHFPTP